MPTASASLSFAFVQLCLRSRLEPAALDAARELTRQEGFDWDEVFRLARQHVVGPLVYDALRDEPDLPARVRQSFRSAYTYTGRRNRVLFEQLAQALPALQAAGTPAIVLKGGALAATVYGDRALRPLRDLDLLIGRDGLTGAVRALQPLGYQPLNAEWAGAAVIPYEGEVALRKSDIVEILLELHWSLLEPVSGGRRAPVPVHWFWETAVPFELGNTRGLALGPEAQVVYLCAHAWTRHAEDGLLWLHDIALALHHHRGRIAWESTVEFARQHDLAQEVGQALSRVVEGWGPLVPLEVLDQMRPAGAPGGKMRSEARLGSFRRAWASLLGESSWGGRARHAWRLAFPPAAYMQRRYHPRYPVFLPFYYVARWVEALGRLFLPG